MSLFGNRLHVISDLPVEAAIVDVRALLEAQGLVISLLHESRFSLEDVFISVVERAREQGKVAVEA